MTVRFALPPVSLRAKIRAITDALSEGEWIRSAAICARLPEPRPDSVSHITSELKALVELGALVRRGPRNRFEYRSGAQPIIDRRKLAKGKPRAHATTHLGFLALARIEKENPTEWARLTANDRGFKGKASATS